jgi:hypothetical protein
VRNSGPRDRSHGPAPLSPGDAYGIDRPLHIRRWLAVAAIGLLLLAGVGYAVLRVKFEGADLGSNIATILNKRMRGRIEIGSVEWPAAGLKKVLTGGWVPLTLRDVRVWDDCVLSADVADDDDEELRTGDPNEDCTPDDRPDPDPTSKRKPRKLLLRTPLITAEIDVHSLLFGKHDVVIRNAWIRGGEALLEETREPYPLHAYDRTIVSIATAFYPRMQAGFRTGIYADAPPPIVDLRDIHVQDLNLTIHFVPYPASTKDKIAYKITARLEGVEIDAGPNPRNDAYLYMDAEDPLVAKFYVRLGVTARRGLLRVDDEGPRDAFRIPVPPPPGGSAPVPPASPPPATGRTSRYEIALTDIRLNRLAQLPTEWPRKDFVANTLELDLEARTLPCPPADRKDQPPDPAQGARLHLTGELHNWWDRPYDGSWNLALDAKNLGPTIKSCIMPAIGGENLDGRITLTGPFVAPPAVGLDLQNLDYELQLSAEEEPLRLTLAEVHGKIDLVNEQGYLDKTKALIQGGKEPGEVNLSATFGLKPLNMHASVEIAKAIDLGRFLPPKVVAAAGKFVHGRLRANGDTEEGFALDDFDLSLGMTPTGRSLRVYRGRLFTDDNFGTIKIDKVAVSAGRNNAVFDGWVKPAADDMDVSITGDFPDLGVWLQRFDLPVLATSAGGGKIVIKGKITAPTVTMSQFQLGGVPCINNLRVDSAVVTQTRVDAKVRSTGLGGELTGTLGLDTSNAIKRIDRLAVSGRGLDAARLCGLTGVKGTLDTVEAEVANATIDPNRSAMDWLAHAQVHARSSKLDVLGDRYKDVAVCLNRKNDQVCRPRPSYLDADDLEQCKEGKRGGFCAVATAERVGGGMINATVAKLPATRTARGGTPERLGGTIELSDLPLGLLEQFLGAKLTGGLASAKLHLEGTPAAPQARGAFTLLRAWALDAFLGDAQLAIEPATIEYGAKRTMAGVALRGSALAGRLQISGKLGTSAPFPVELSITGRRIELDVLLDLQKRFGLPTPVQAWATGTITVKTELAPEKPVEPEAWIELAEVWAIYNHRAADGRITPIRMSVVSPPDRDARTAVSMRVTPSGFELACKDPTAPVGRKACSTRIGTPVGVIEVRGYVEPESIAISAGGVLDLSLLASLVDATFDDISGRAKLTASVGGTLAAPRYEAALELDNAVARPLGKDTDLEAPSGLIKLANGSLGFTDVKLRVRDQHRDEAGELHVKGNIALDGFRPVRWGVLISGKIAGKMLSVVAPGAVSSASGLARIEGDLLLSGKGDLPTVAGAIVFDPPPPCVGDATTAPDGTDCRRPGELSRALALIPRGVGRELSFTRGRIEIETTEDQRGVKLTLGDRRDPTANVRASIGGEGAFDNISGTILLSGGALTELDVTLDIKDIPFRVPGTLDLVLSSTGIWLVKQGQHGKLGVNGNITIIDGTYQRNLTITDQLLALGASGPPTKPFWEEYPTIGDANLNLELFVKRFVVANNIANIELKSDKISIKNTPRDPRLAGAIAVARGEFRFPGTRAKFTRTSGTITFDIGSAAGNPTLEVTSDAPDYRDLSGQNHVITLKIEGRLQQLGWDLRTSTGYNKSQTLSLLVLGRNSEQLRRSLGEQSLGGDPLRADPTTNPSQGFADQIVKDLAGDWVSGLLGDSLGRIIGLDVLRIEIGFGSIGFHVEKKILENLKLLGQTEQTIRGSTIDGRAQLKTPYGFNVELGYLNKDFSDPAEQDIKDYGVRAVYRLFVP